MQKLLDDPKTAGGFGISHNPSNYTMNGETEGIGGDVRGRKKDRKMCVSVDKADCHK